MNPRCFSAYSCPLGAPKVCQRGILFLSFPLFYYVAFHVLFLNCHCRCPQLCDMGCEAEYRRQNSQRIPPESSGGTREFTGASRGDSKAAVP